MGEIMKKIFSKKMIVIMIPCLLVSFWTGFFSLIFYMIFASLVHIIFLNPETWGNVEALITVIPIFTICIIPMIAPVFFARGKIKKIVGEENMKKVMIGYAIKCEVLMVIVIIILIKKFAYIT